MMRDLTDAAPSSDHLPWLPAPFGRHLALTPGARLMGIRVLAGIGAGKSTLLGRGIAWQDFLAGVPVVILDPTGGTIDYFLGKIASVPVQYRPALWQRVRYIDMSGKGKTCPWPLYYRLGDESLYAISQRHLDVIRKSDPALASASIQGWNPLHRIGSRVGMVLAALGCQVTEAAALLEQPTNWAGRFAEALTAHPELAPVIDFFTDEYAHLDVRGRRDLTSSYLTKVTDFALDPALKAMFGANTPGIAWQHVEEQQQAVLLDFRHVESEQGDQMRRFKMLWAFSTFIAYVKHRGPGGRRPISLIIDELSALTNLHAHAENPFVKDLNELINVLMRQYRLWVTIGHQELTQVDQQVQDVLLNMGTQIIGRTSNSESALTLAKQVFRVDPELVKRYRPVRTSYMGMSEVIDHEPIEYSIEEQQYQQSYTIKDQPTFRFLVRPALREGVVAPDVYPISVAGLGREPRPTDAVLARVRDALTERDGRVSRDVLDEVTSRQAHAVPEVPQRSGKRKS